MTEPPARLATTAAPSPLAAPPVGNAVWPTSLRAEPNRLRFPAGAGRDGRGHGGTAKPKPLGGKGGPKHDQAGRP